MGGKKDENQNEEEPSTGYLYTIPDDGYDDCSFPYSIFGEVQNFPAEAVSQ